MRIEIIACHDCNKQRHKPQVPEAYHGWKLFGNGSWSCPSCLQAMVDREKEKLLADIATMCEEDVDVFLMYINEYPEDFADDPRFRDACFSRLRELRGA